MDAPNAQLWMVIRTDSHGKTYLMKDNLSSAAAEEMVTKFTLRGHRQMYEAIEYTAATKKAIIEQRRIEV